MAIGSPFGLENTVTAGIVSAKQRDTGDYLPFIQTDVAINPATRGAADQPARRGGGHQLADLQPLGRLHGHQLRHPDRRGQRVADQLRANGRVVRGRIGVQIGR
jgi:serine protease Do